MKISFCPGVILGGQGWAVGLCSQVMFLRRSQLNSPSAGIPKYCWVSHDSCLASAPLLSWEPELFGFLSLSTQGGREGECFLHTSESVLMQCCGSFVPVMFLIIVICANGFEVTVLWPYLETLTFGMVQDICFVV